MKYPKNRKSFGASTLRRLLYKVLAPSIPPSNTEKIKHRNLLSQKSDDFRCVYCGQIASNWDHFEAIVSEAKPSGYISEIFNFVPACSSCNQSRGNRNWEEWMQKKFENEESLHDRIKILKRFENNSNRINYYESEFSQDQSLQNDLKDYVNECRDLIKSYERLMRNGRELSSRIEYIIMSKR